MRQVSLKGLTKVRKTLADGTTVYYCYPWRGGPLLRHSDGSPIQPGDATLPVAYEIAHELRRCPRTDDLAALIAEFKASADFRNKRPSTKREYNRYLDMIREQFGHTSIADLQQPSARGVFKGWRDTLAEKPRAADYAWTALARLLSFAKDRGRISTNVCERGGRLYHVDRRERLWTQHEFDRVAALAPAGVRLAMQMALWTGQRKGDILGLEWSSYDGSSIRLKQSKTDARVIIPVAAALKAELEALPRMPGAIIRNSRGSAWTAAGFATAWKRAREAANVHGLTFHDLRGTAVTRLALAGCTAAEIGALTGHSMRDVDQILDAHYLGGKEALARQAIAKIEAASPDAVTTP